MKTEVIGEVAKETLTELSSRVSQPTLQRTNKAWLTKVKSPGDLLRIYAPANWGYVLGEPDKAYTASCPTMHEVFSEFGTQAAEDWIRVQVTSLFVASSSKEIGVADGIVLFSKCFAAEVKPYKVTELMLFFSRYKAGRYDNSYSSFDSRRIGAAFFKEFVKERAAELDKIERQKKSDEIINREPVKVPDGFTPYTWYLELKKRAESGDKEAKQLLKMN